MAVSAPYPLQMIWMPMHNRMKAESRISTLIPLASGVIDRAF